MALDPPEPGLPLKERLIAELRSRPGQKAADLAAATGFEKAAINACLYGALKGQVQQGNDYRWRLLEAAPKPPPTSQAPASEFSRLCRYYLECIGQDMVDGVSAFAKSNYGDPVYAQLPALPMAGGPVDWWHADGVARVLAKVREDKAKLVTWIGYPVRLRRHRTPTWEGFFVEPVMLWQVTLPEPGEAGPSIAEDAPLLNMKFLRSMAMGDGMQLAEEAAALTEELGLNVPSNELPDARDLFDRLRYVRADWDWREELDPASCGDGPALDAIVDFGIYNRAILVPGERSPFTQGLETELKTLAGTPEAQLAETALGAWLAGGATEQVPPLDDQPLIEVLPMNTEQRAAVRAALSSPHTVVTGPPGTGKSQVVTNLLINAAWRGMKVLFASKNNKAVDVVEARVNGLGNRPVLLRLGAKEYQTKLASYLTQMLSGNPGAEDQQSYDEALERHRGLAERLSRLDEAVQATVDARNSVDRLDAENEDVRVIFGARFAGLDGPAVDGTSRALTAYKQAVDAADRSQQGFITRVAWPLVVKRRHEALMHAAKSARAPAAALGLSVPASPSDPGLRAESRLIAEWHKRGLMARKVVAYKLALAALQQSPALEDTARQRHELAQQISQNSERLWRDWVQLAPKRLSPAQRRDIADYVAVLQVITAPDAGQVHGSVWAKAKTLQAKVSSLFSCWAVTSLSAKGRVPLEPGHFDLVVIDEASQCDIASALPLLYRAKRSVIIGDPMQLRHISALTRPRDSELQHKHGLVETRTAWMYSVSSLYDVAAGVVQQGNIVNLRDHHRSHADIIGFSNRAFYEGRLRVATRHPQLKRPKAGEPGVLWQDVAGKATRPAQGGAQNRVEAQALVDALVDLLATRQYPGTVGVVTPFRAQAQLLQELVQGRKELDVLRERADLLVDTVHRFQGDERDVMFFSPVVAGGISTGAIGFLRNNGNLFNVAITRARGLLHVVGDRNAAAQSGVDYLANFVAYVGALSAAPKVAPETALEFGPDYPTVARPERVSDWERVLYRAMYAAGLRPVPQYSVEQYDLDFALFHGDRKLNIEVDGERYHKSWTGELCLRDQLRNQRLIELGWEVKRFWVYEVRDQLDECTRKLCDWADAGKDSTAVPADMPGTSHDAMNA